MSVVGVLLTVLGAYGAVGVLFAIAFVCTGAKRIDPVARATPLRVRLLFLPGAAALWPLLAMKWARSRTANAR
ncbi:MAG: hypothetical protein KDA20_09155 [Phycisphaerales bacterium]|nr:hypothetical protein [Phycisphaerales bacterium]